MVKGGDSVKGYGFGTFQGVFTPSILTIIGVVMYLRFGWMVGNVGLAVSLFIVTLGNAITFLTGLSISALATNMRIKGGGAYFILSRTLGVEAGAALGIPLALSQTVAVSFYVAGFAEAFVQSGLPVISGWDPRVVGLATLAVIAVATSVSADIALKSQYFVMAAIGVSLVSFFLGGTPENIPPPQSVPEALGFWPVFAVFFPAVTGILSGLGMSGDLKNPARSIPLGTLAAIVTGYIVYMTVPIVLDFMVSDPATLRSDTMILQKCARWQTPILIGVWAATLSSAVGSFLCSPRVFQALSRDGVMPAFFGKGFGDTDDPRVASLFCFALAAAGIALGDINVLAPVLTLFNLSTYGLLNLCAACEEMLGNPAWRPSFRVKAYLSFAGFAGCLGAMFMISPGWTFVALVCEIAIYWYMKRRALRARWGDMRTGITAAVVRIALRHLEKKSHAERNWRPNLLVFTKLPVTGCSYLVLAWAKTIAGGRSLVTVASVLPVEASDSAREQEIRGSVARVAEKAGLEAAVKLISASNPWTGMSELVRSYGFGPLLPNTVLLGVPRPENAGYFAAFLKQLVSLRRNAVLLGNSGLEDTDGPLDIWWRGNNLNAGLMMALAVLVQRAGIEQSRRRRLRVNMIIRRRTPEEANSVLKGFLSDARVEAESRVIDSGDRPFADIIREESKGAALALVGLRKPGQDETTEEYADYFRALAQSLSAVPSLAFVLAAEDVDFRRIFSDKP